MALRLKPPQGVWEGWNWQRIAKDHVRYLCFSAFVKRGQLQLSQDGEVASLEQLRNLRVLCDSVVKKWRIL